MGEATIDGGSLDASTTQIVNLILHQGYERGDDDAGAILSQGGHLESDGLSTACRHQSQCVVAATYGLDDFALNTAEIIVAPVIL